MVVRSPGVAFFAHGLDRAAQQLAAARLGQPRHEAHACGPRQRAEVIGHHLADLGLELPRLGRVGHGAASARHHEAIATWPFSPSATPTTATSATFAWPEMASSISRVPSRWPATLMTSSVRPWM